MILIHELNKSQFKLKNFKFIIGEYATYNNYFEIILDQNEATLEIGLQTITGGIKPQADIFFNKLLLLAGNNFYIYDLDNNIIKQLPSDSIYYEFIIRNDKVLVINELSVLLLDSKLEKIWGKDFNEIIDIDEIKESKIILRDYDGKLIYLDYLTGKELLN